MGTDRNIQIGILIGEVLMLSLFIYGFYHLIYLIDPLWVYGTGRMRRLLMTYIVSFLSSYSFYPSIIQQRLVKGEEVARRVIATCCLMLLFIALIALITRPYIHFPRKFLCTSVFFFAILLFIERFSLRRYLMHIRSNKRNQKRIVLVGNEQTVYRLYDIFSTPAYGYNIIGSFFDGECQYKGLAQLRLGGIGDIYGWLTNHSDFNEIYGYFPKEQQDTINMISKFCDNHLIRFYYIPAIDVFNSNMTCTFIEGIPIIARRDEPMRNPFNQIVKRVFDIIFSALVLILVFPWVWLIVAIMIKIQSPGPIFFVQERTGLDGKIFKCIKFRSMKVNDDADKVQATKNDPRKFPFGTLMRRTNIDEIPQFINVFIGDMSVVGPRPHMLKHTEEYSRLINRFMVRHLAKPGITGLAQVTGFRGETKYIDQMEGRVKKDIEYIENWTFLLDIKIIIKTVTNMFGREKGNAY